MPEHLEKADPSALADGVDSPMLDQEDFEVEEEDVDMDEDEEEEVSEGEEKEDVEAEEEEDDEEEASEFEEEEEVEGGDSEGEEVEELVEYGVDREQEEIDEVEEGEEEGEGNEEQEAEEVEEEDDDEGSGEEEIGEEEMVVEDERRGKYDEESAVISAEAASAAPEDAKARDNAEKHHAYDHSKVLSTNIKEFNGTSVSKGSSALVSEHITSEENGNLETLLGETCKGVRLEKEITNESPKHVNNNSLETQGSLHSLGSDNARSLQPLKSDLSIEGGVRNESEIVNYNVSEKGESHLQEKINSQLLEDLTPTCGHTPQRRPRSSSPGSEPDRMNKRLANICVFYARGWCIKGNSCKFLHQEDGVIKIEQQTKEDKSGNNRALDSRATTGSEKISERSKISSALLESNPKGSLGCNSQLQRALVRTYGIGSHMTSQLADNYDIHSKGEFQQSDHVQADYSSTREENKKTYGKMSHFESIVERQPVDAFLSRRHLIEGKLVNEINKEDSPYDMTISGRTRPVDTFLSNAKHYSDGSATSSILHQNSNSLSPYGKTEGNAIRSMQSHFLNQESYNSHSLEDSQNSRLGGSFPFPQLDYRRSRAGTPPTSGSTRNTEYLEGHSLLDLDRRYRGSGSISLTRDSSPYNSRSERNMIHHNIPSDLTSRQTKKIQYDAWEPSQPFRPSLAIGTKSISSPSQYDPILDSIEPATANARDCFHTSRMTPFQNASFFPTKTENASSWDGMLAKNVSLHDSSAHASADVFFTSTKLEGANNSIPSNEKLWNSDRLLERSNYKDAELGGEWKNIDKSRNIKESKALKIFHTALVDLVKELLKPWWREGQLSKDAHKTVVKKSVEKVLSALQSHQIPSTQEAINQYLTTSRQKIFKLVEGYAQKHANS
ncbi:hypothetical protein IEQ34_016547 [Dendrobium chrysotoxum]|uniref:C3H1-type domain-containing protein n=1 Tax=Dendrobium chrysotoxum TaxID=161865 RepID=A0AAV7GGS1_DENCH|nr:hypothetical protein IEQ34_016547 [Dendrobium chrysotoxum]